MVQSMFGKLKSLLKSESNDCHLRKIAFLRIDPINFSIRNTNEKQIINSGFQRFLNSIDFPLQIVVGTNHLNLDSYLSKMELRVEELESKTKNKSLSSQFTSY